MKSMLSAAVLAVGWPLSLMAQGGAVPDKMVSHIPEAQRSDITPYGDVLDALGADDFICIGPKAASGKCQGVLNIQKRGEDSFEYRLFSVVEPQEGLYVKSVIEASAYIKDGMFCANFADMMSTSQNYLSDIPSDKVEADDQFLNVRGKDLVDQMRWVLGEVEEVCSVDVKLSKGRFFTYTFYDGRPAPAQMQLGPWAILPKSAFVSMAPKSLM